LNATSDLGFTATNTQQNNTGQQTTNTVSASNIIVQNNKGFLVNGNFQGKITQTAPTLRFRGKGELAFMSPTGASSINTLAYQSYSGLIGAIISFVGNSVVTNANNIDYSQVFGGAQAAVKNALDDLKVSYLSTGGIDDTFSEAVVETLHVSGTRRYL
jgi:N-acetylneuraminic acid mutarotase